jgi:urease accessory protein
MPTDIITTEPLLRLMHLVSPSLPVGAFTYSQGIEWVVEEGWVRSAEDLEAWLRDQLRNTISTLDLPLLLRMHASASKGDADGMEFWIRWLVAARETAELRAEEANRGRAFADLLDAWGLLGEREIVTSGSTRRWKSLLAHSQSAGFAFAAVAWAVPPREMAAGYAWGWLENLVLAAVKTIPLGQTQGQQVLMRLVSEVPELLEQALTLPDQDIGASSPALAIASSAHETQYTRLFRS